MLHRRWTFIQPDVRNCGKGILKMKKILSFVLMMCVLMTIPMFAFAAVSGDEPLTIGTPFMITNAGQGPGGKMGRLLVSRAGTLTEDEDFYYVDVPYAADVDARDYSAIVIVIGSTDKGLGATGITIDQEIARVDEVVARANEKGVPVIAVMLEKDKRSDVKTNSNERLDDRHRRRQHRRPLRCVQGRKRHPADHTGFLDGFHLSGSAGVCEGITAAQKRK